MALVMLDNVGDILMLEQDDYAKGLIILRAKTLKSVTNSPNES